MPISNVALTNTFDEWRVITNQLSSVVNDMLNDGSLGTYRSITANVSSSNVISSNTITANVLFISTLNVLSTLQSSFGVANVANTVSIAAFNRANVANTTANNSVQKAGDTMTGNLSVPSVGIGTTTPAANLDVVGSVSDSRANNLSQTLTYSTTIAWDGALGRVAYVTLTGNATLANISNQRVGVYILHVIQDSVGGRTLDFELGHRFTANIRPPLTATANARDIISFVSDGTRTYGSFLPDVG